MLSGILISVQFYLWYLCLSKTKKSLKCISTILNLFIFIACFVILVYSYSKSDLRLYQYINFLLIFLYKNYEFMWRELKKNIF